MRALALAALAAAPLGCGNGPDPPTTLATGEAGEMNEMNEMKEMMTWVLDPAADVIWGSAGFVITAAGEVSLAPTTDEGWAQVRHSAAVLAEGGNLLLLPQRLPAADQRAAWTEFSAGMTRIAQDAATAAEAQDSERLFEVGGHLYNVCLACHQVYARDDADAAADG